MGAVCFPKTNVAKILVDQILIIGIGCSGAERRFTTSLSSRPRRYSGFSIVRHCRTFMYGQGGFRYGQEGFMYGHEGFQAGHEGFPKHLLNSTPL